MKPDISPSLAAEVAAPGVARTETSFLRHVLTLGTGTAAAQILPLALTPVLTRVFSPADFGHYSIFASLAALAGVAATLRYTYALLLPEHDDDALCLGMLCGFITFIVAMLVAAAALPFSQFWAGLLGQPQFEPLLWLLPVCTILAGLQITLYSLANRHRSFRIMSISKMAQAAGTVSVSLVLGYGMANKALALAIGYAAGQLSAVLVLSRSALAYRQGGLPLAREIAKVAKRYKNFALLSLPADFLNTLTNQLPIFVIAYYFTETVAGHFNLTFRVIMGPLGIIGVALLDVFKERAARAYGETGTCRPLFLKTAKTLALVGTPALLALYPAAPFLFSKAFGAEWREAGEYAQILIPLFICRFIVSPLSFIIYIAEKQNYDLLWQSVLLLVVGSSFYIGGSTGDIRLALHLFSWSYSAMYVVYFYVNFLLAERKVR